MTTFVRSALAAAAVVVWLPVAALGQGQGTIVGHVVDATTRQPVVSAQVTVAGTTLGAVSGTDGAFRITNVRPGTVTVRAQRIGYAARSVTVTVTAGQETTADLALEPTAAVIDEVVVTASGETTRKRESGATVATISLDSLPLAPINNFSDVLQSRAAGVTVQSAGGTAGTGSRIRIRGSNSISLSNDPIIIVDGVRLNNDANSTTIGVGGQQPSRFDDINWEDIADIQIIKGPAAATLYGTAAANGVIQITTKQGRAGQARWTGYAEYGPEHQVASFPANYRMFGTRTNGSLTTNCNIIAQAAGTCRPDSLVSFNPLEVYSPFVDGYREGYGLSASGGSQAATYYVAGDYYREQGIYDPNTVRRINLRANATGRPGDKLELRVSTNYLQSRAAFPQNDNNSFGILPGGLLGSFRDNPQTHGYFFTTPDKLLQLDTRQDVERFTGGIAANYQPISWLKGIFQSGIDYTSRYDQFFIGPNIFSPDEDADLNAGQRQSNPYQIWDYTANAAVTGNFQLQPTITSSTTLGVQYHREYLHGTEAFGEGIAPGTSSLNGATKLFQVDEATSDIITIGGYVQQEFGWRDRLFLSAGVRTDRNSAFGVNKKWVAYPSVNLSWVVSEEPFFPRNRILTSLRLRSAFGQSGQHPLFRNAITFFNPVAVTVVGQEVPGVTIGGTGNVDLRPEKSSEYEAGFEAAFWQDRASLEFTYYNKTTRDALVAQRLAPSLGVSNTRFVNLGEVRNTGIEVLLNATPVALRNVRFDLTVNASTNNNKVVNLGRGITPIIFGLGGDTQRHQNGYPLGGYWQRPILSFSDANGDGIIAPSEVQVGDTGVFLGSAFPKREVSITPRLTLFRYAQVSALFDYRGGFKLFNGTADFRCGTFLICRAIQDKSTPLAEQAKAVADAQFGTVAGYIEDATFWKLRELSITLSAPRSWATRAGLEGMSLILAGRNLHTWTKYSGFDPEVNGGAQANFNQFDFLTQPPVRYYTVRLNLTW